MSLGCSYSKHSSSSHRNRHNIHKPKRLKRTRLQEQPIYQKIALPEFFLCLLRIHWYCILLMYALSTHRIGNLIAFKPFPNSWGNSTGMNDSIPFTGVDSKGQRECHVYRRNWRLRESNNLWTNINSYSACSPATRDVCSHDYMPCWRWVVLIPDSNRSARSYIVPIPYEFANWLPSTGLAITNLLPSNETHGM